MEKKLKSLFEFQRFENEPRLARIIAEAEGHAARPRLLEDDDLEMLYAAGTPDVPHTEQR